MKEEMRRNLSAGDVLFHEGSQGTDVFLLECGSLGIFKGETRVAKLTRPGIFVGEMAALLERPRTATVTALSDSVLARLPLSLEASVQKFPNILEKLFLTLQTRLETTCNKINLYDEMIYQESKMVLLNLACAYEKIALNETSFFADTKRAKIRSLIDEKIEESFADGDFEFLDVVAQNLRVMSEYREEVEESYGCFFPLQSQKETLVRWKGVKIKPVIAHCRKISKDVSSVTDRLFLFDSSSEIRQRMSQFQLERVVPLDKREEILKEILFIPDFEKHISEINEGIQKAIRSSGKDVPRLFPFAEQYGKAMEYQGGLENFLNHSDISNTLTDVKKK